MAARGMHTGDVAVAGAVLAVQPDVVAAYPITPQTGIVERLSSLAADGELLGEFVKVDSEYTAASCCIGASAAGARVFSATCSQGLKLMSEPLFTAAGMRLPVVMAVANRSLSAPLSIWNDHTDAFAERDGGMIQFFAADVQEAVDMVLVAYRVAEDPRVSLPALVNLDGFVLTHVQEPVVVPSAAAVAEFLPRRVPHATLDPSDPVTMGAYARPEHWTETRYMVHDAVRRAERVIADAIGEFSETFNRESRGEYGGLLEVTGNPEARTAIVVLGSLAGTVQRVIADRSADVKLVRPRVLRPVPAQALRAALAGVEAVGVLQKEVSPGYQGSLAGEIKSVLYGVDDRPVVRSFVVGLGGRDVPRNTIASVLDETEKAAAGGVGSFTDEESWPQLRRGILAPEVGE